jgi:hypothetical protein
MELDGVLLIVSFFLVVLLFFEENDLHKNDWSISP